MTGWEWLVLGLFGGLIVLGIIAGHRELMHDRQELEKLWREEQALLQAMQTSPTGHAIGPVEFEKKLAVLHQRLEEERIRNGKENPD